MKAALKYCGGCNPRFDRAALAARLKEEGGIEWALPGEHAEHTVVICGCERCCVKAENAVKVCRPEDYNAALELIRKINEA